MIAADPYPVERTGEALQDGGGTRGQPLLAGIVMEIVTEAVDGLGPDALHQRIDRLHRCAAVIGGQHLAGRCVEAALFQMQIGHQ